MTPRAVRLADHRKPLGEVVLPSGRTVPVRAITGRAQDLREAIVAGEAKDGDLWRLAALLLPTATEEEIKDMEPSDIAVVVEIATGHFDAMLALAQAEGKSEAPETTAAPHPDPAPGSAPSSPD